MKSSANRMETDDAVRIPSPFPPHIVIEHLPPDGRHYHQRSRLAAAANQAVNMMNYQPVKMVASSRMTDQKKATPPPPPPRGVTLRSTSAVAAAISAHNGGAGVGAHHRNNKYKENQPSSSAQAEPSHRHLTAAPVGGTAHQPGTTGYLETRYAYSVNGILGSAAQASAAAAFFARASQKLNLASPQRRKRHGSSSDGGESPVPASVHRFGTDFSGLLRRNPPAPPAHLLRRLGLRENPGVGKVRVLLRVAGDPSSSTFLSVDKKRKQLTLQEPNQHAADQTVENRRVGVAAPKMFAFDGLFTSDDSQGDVAGSVLSDIVTAVINGSDGCVFCYGHAQLGKTTTMVGSSCSEDIGPGLMPTAIAWLFRGIAEQKSKTGARFSVRVSAVEIAGPAETLRDLLAPHATESEESPGVYLRDDPLLGTQLQNQSELRAPTAEKAAFYLDAALAARTDASSPDARFSHLLYTLHVYQYSVDRKTSNPAAHGHHTAAAGGGVAGGRSRLHLLDLGSCQSAGGSTMSLSGLGNVLVALFNGQRHLPHREHKITQVLRECLGSLTCQAALVAHVAASSAYSETLSTVQMASRVHRMRRRRMKYNNAGSGGGGSGSGGSNSEDSGQRMGLSRSSGGESSTGGSADPSSSEQSCDTVIYVGPIDDATDGEHPPVYLPSLNSGDHRCSMSRALRGSTVDRPTPSSTAATTSPRKEGGLSRSPQIQRKVAAAVAKPSANQEPTVEEQWIDGPRFNKTRISQARMQVVRHQREMWIDGPTAATTLPATAASSVHPAPSVVHSPNPAIGYGFMDQHKQGMIRQWVENQSNQRHPAVRTNGQMWIDSQPRPAPEPGTPVKVLTVFKTCPDEDDECQVEESPIHNPITPIPPKGIDHATMAEHVRSPRANRHPSAVVPVGKQSRRKADIPLTSTEVVAKQPEEVPPPSTASCLNPLNGGLTSAANNLTLEQLYSQCQQLAESLVQEVGIHPQAADGVTSEEEGDDLSAALDVTSEQVSMSCESWRHEDIHPSGRDYSPEYIEVEEPDEPVPTQDSCLQVTEEDIALSMSQMKREMEADVDGLLHPLRALSQDNLTVISHFTGETYSQGTASDWEPIEPTSASAADADYYQTQLEQLAELHQQMYLQQSAGTQLHPTPLSAMLTGTNCNLGSFKDLPMLTHDWNSPAVTVRTSPGRNGVNSSADPSGKALVSTIGMELERQLGLQDQAAGAILSSLRHPDGASDPHLDQHNSKNYETVRPSDQQRLPGNGASCSDPEEEVVVAVPTEKSAPQKTPKLSRFFSKNKKPSVSKKNTATSTMSASPLPVAKSSSSSAKGSPKVEKRSKSRDAHKHESPAKSPARNIADTSALSAGSSIPPSPKSSKSSASTSAKKEAKLKPSSLHKSPKKDSKSTWEGKLVSSSKRDVKSYGFSYESHQQTAPSSLCPSEGYESGGSDSGVHLSAVSPIKNRRHHIQQQQQQIQRRQHLMPIGEMPRKNFSSGTSTSGSGGSGGSAGHYESSGYESVIRDSECSSLGSSSQDSDTPVPTVTALTLAPNKIQTAAIGQQSSSCVIL